MISEYRVSIGKTGLTCEPVYRCRCGIEHQGPYAEYDYGHHMCFHDAPLVPIHEGYFCCADCGKNFWVEGEMRLEYPIAGGQRGKYVSFWRSIILYLQQLYR